MWPNAYPLGVLQAPHTDDASARLAMDAECHERVHPEDDARYAAQELGVRSEAAERGSVIKKEPSPAQLAKAARHPEESGVGGRVEGTTDSPQSSARPAVTA